MSEPCAGRRRAPLMVDSPGKLVMIFASGWRSSASVSVAARVCSAAQAASSWMIRAVRCATTAVSILWGWCSAGAANAAVIDRVATRRFMENLPFMVFVAGYDVVKRPLTAGCIA